MNRWYGVGNLTKDPETSVTQNGTDVAKFIVAVNRPKDESGESKADFIPVKARGKKAALVREYLRKGRKVAVEGKLQTYNYTNQDGQRRSGFEVILDELTFLPSGDPNNTRHGDIHQDGGVIHNDIGDRFEPVDMDDGELPF